jgi:Xaa-Pro aminopeptidase
MAVQSQEQMLKKLRQEMKTCVLGNAIHAYLIPTSDNHQSEYLAECDKRLSFLTHFTGSAGTAVITLDGRQLLWTDGRYFEQAQNELSSDWTLQKDGLTNTLSISDWLIENLPAGSRVGVNSFLMSHRRFQELDNKLQKGGTGLQLLPLIDDLVDLVWTKRPARPNQPIRPLPLSYTGRSWADKVIELRNQMRAKQAQLLLISALDEVAWLLNLRGSDVAYNPVFFAYVAVTDQQLVLFVNETQMTAEAKAYLQLQFNGAETDRDGSDADSVMQGDTNEQPQSSVCIQLEKYSSVGDFIHTFVSNQAGKLWLPSSSSYALTMLVPENRRIQDASPIALAKALKNPVEIEGMKSAQLKDSVALCEFFAWLEENVPKGGVTELSASAHLFQLRSQQANFVQSSFESISASGPNGAIIHYRPTESSNRLLCAQEMYLIDSGAQYLDGTTDVTRTIHFGSPSEFEREAFTRVLKGHIALATTVFPTGVKGHCLDSHARRALWAAGLNYLHGTGHGVGCFLNVHEGPMGIGSRPMAGDPGLAEHMILSNEPGYYEPGKFGIRIESLMLTCAKQTKVRFDFVCFYLHYIIFFFRKFNQQLQYSFNNTRYLCFETITLVPIQVKMLEQSLLTSEEVSSSGQSARFHTKSN